MGSSSGAVRCPRCCSSPTERPATPGDTSGEDRRVAWDPSPRRGYERLSGVCALPYGESSLWPKISTQAPPRAELAQLGRFGAADLERTARAPAKGAGPE